MNTKHTPGQWLIDGVEPKSFVYALNQQGYNRFWAHVQGGNTAPMEQTTVEEVEANARLIAAAPDLLEALKHCVDWLNAAGIAQSMPVQKQARAAIAKATGEAS